MEATLQLFGAATAFFTIGLVMTLYEWRRSKSGRPLGKGGQAVQLYYMTYLVMFALAIVTAAKAVVG